ncbi:MAG: hypothetical protein JGK24_30110 [Microcoleus sp. PH2017_29_MFU_D_A]|uniref:hypothetical protein n=1 Tax=unclassified Microcoleus TaxID=2642155 RepID=UPI001D3148EC|nr:MULTISPECIES: hypothetical protein [unclassified Microcoleus]MCC3421970.1 hypothetical protein [Microcoleus sp. PH2017_07_MST_O_A]MCC3431701.1 hypothetical protein [Microcoleus sp. PH2017_04_SCI_O_A]MCC3443233.1 hypothetical protein [Microcoleus sp. PH2017_03_ELD_O_A]MCC3506151.1 hypothetical protein [Microcoleus sp. PH2017_19_SFW_U_A]MCC3512048.1 hypothetical protein [Microcoleus sp. PH2017_17_BER_D_A]TAE55664.1 MAG: hypothetical protein EAZ88_06020 [Oscillatoriales cyanobacterium]
MTTNYEFDSLADSAIVYRALLRRQWIDETSDIVLLFAYLLRPNEPGLSVTIASVCSPEQCAAKFNNCFGVASLQVGQIRELGLDAVPDSASHALIVGLPQVKDDRDRAERLADLLAERSRIVWTPSQT